MKWFLLGLALYAGMALAGPDERLAAAKLRTYCKACHGVGELRFIFTENDDDLWKSLFTQMTPGTKRPWAVAIREVLDWPDDVTPAFDQMISIPDRDWMPKGAKRASFATDRVGSVPTRRFILDQICRDSSGFCSY